MTHSVSPLPLPLDEIARLAARHNRANRGVMALVNKLGGQFEDKVKLIPKPIQRAIFAASESALHASYGVASQGERVGVSGGKLQSFLAGASGAVGGFGGLATSVVEIPFTITLILRAIQEVAQEHGFDPRHDDTRREVLRVFSSGTPMDDDDGVNSAFLGARLAMSGGTIQAMISKVAPKIAATLSQKLAAQAVPILGAATGAALNLVYVNYYRELAHIRFGMLKLAMTHDAEALSEAFAEALAQPRLNKI